MRKAFFAPEDGRGLIDFYQEAVRTRSYSDEEGELAHLVTARMEALGFDEVFIDPAGNAVGRVGEGARILHFDSHMDTVQAGDPAAWRADPFSAEVIDGMVYGRGTVDMKGGAGRLPLCRCYRQAGGAAGGQDGVCHRLCVRGVL